MLGIHMSLKVHFLYSQLDRFSENLGDVSDKQVKRFHQDIKIEEKYKGRRDINMMTDYF